MLEYREVNGTSYKKETPYGVIACLEHARVMGQRVCIYYGDTKTRRLWGDVESGTIGRSTGRVKIPLIIKTKRSLGGGGILDHCIVKITTTKKPFRVLYQL